MSLVTFLGIYFVQKTRIDIATVGVAFLCENRARAAGLWLVKAITSSV